MRKLKAKVDSCQSGLGFCEDFFQFSEDSEWFLSYEKLFLQNAEMNTETWCSFIMQNEVYIYRAKYT